MISTTAISAGSVATWKMNRVRPRVLDAEENPERPGPLKQARQRILAFPAVIVVEQRGAHQRNRDRDQAAAARNQ